MDPDGVFGAQRGEETDVAHKMNDTSSTKSGLDRRDLLRSRKQRGKDDLKGHWEFDDAEPVGEPLFHSATEVSLRPRTRNAQRSEKRTRNLSLHGYRLLNTDASNGDKQPSETEVHDDPEFISVGTQKNLERSSFSSNEDASPSALHASQLNSSFSNDYNPAKRVRGKETNGLGAKLAGHGIDSLLDKVSLTDSSDEAEALGYDVYGNLIPKSQFGMDAPIYTSVFASSETCIQLKVGHVVSPSEFYVESYPRTTEFRDFEKAMCHFYAGEAQMMEYHAIRNVHIGMYVALRMKMKKKQDKWYRARVLGEYILTPFEMGHLLDSGSTLQHENQVIYTLYLCDHGRFVSALSGDFVKLFKQYASLPIQSARCKLFGVVPYGRGSTTNSITRSESSRVNQNDRPCIKEKKDGQSIRKSMLENVTLHATLHSTLEESPTPPGKDKDLSELQTQLSSYNSDPHLSKRASEWSNQAIEYFADILTSDPMQAQLLGISVHTNSMVINLYLEDETTTVSDALVRSHLAVYDSLGQNADNEDLLINKTNSICYASGEQKSPIPRISSVNSFLVTESDPLRQIGKVSSSLLFTPAATAKGSERSKPKKSIIAFMPTQAQMYQGPNPAVDFKKVNLGESLHGWPSLSTSSPGGIQSLGSKAMYSGLSSTESVSPATSFFSPSLGGTDRVNNGSPYSRQSSGDISAEKSVQITEEAGLDLLKDHEIFQMDLESFEGLKQQRMEFSPIQSAPVLSKSSSNAIKQGSAVSESSSAGSGVGFSICLPHRFGEVKKQILAKCNHCNKYNSRAKMRKCLVCKNTYHEACSQEAAPTCGMQNIGSIMGSLDPAGPSLQNAPMSVTNVTEIPYMLVALVDRIEKDLDVEGLYRISGMQTDVEKVYKLFLYGRPNLKNEDVHMCTSLLKKYLRDLKSPLVSTMVNPTLRMIFRLRDTDRQNRLLGLASKKLPVANHVILRFVIEHLKKIVAHSEHNKMGSTNLALIFGPTLMRSGDLNAGITLDGMFIKYVFYLLTSENPFADESFQ